MGELYFDFPLTDGSRICVLHYQRAAQINHILPDGSIPGHCHGFFELVLILRGSCEHIYQGVSTVLLPGDLFLIAPHRSHAYRFYEDVDHINCQFYADALPAEWLEEVQALRYDHLQQRQPATAYRGAADINRQGILHLGREEAEGLSRLFLEILAEQTGGRPDAGRMNRCLLQIALLRLGRAQSSQYVRSEPQQRWRQEMIGDALSAFERDLAAEVDIAALARRYHVSVSYFRSIFRDVTGLPPRQYLNRVRVVRAVELMNRQGLGISETAERVGIYDPNYFSRLCKKLTGYPPSHFLSRNGSAPSPS